MWPTDLLAIAVPAQIALVVLGGAAVWLGAELLVRGASRLAKAFGISEFVVGATIVAFGTSAPEWFVSLIAQLDGKSEISLGNIIGSNVANLGLGLGATALLIPVLVPTNSLKRELPIVLGVEIAFAWMCLDGSLGALDGALLLGAFLAVYAGILTLARRRPQIVTDLVDVPVEPRQATLLRDSFVTVCGLTVLLVGAHYFVVGAEAFAIEMGMSRETVGLTIVAIGTSLPELGTSIVAAVRGSSAMSIGNLLGSNLFNVLLVGGTLAVIDTVPVAPSIEIDLWWMIGVTAVVLPLSFLGAASQDAMGKTRRVGRWSGLLLFGSYLVYLASKFI